MVASASVESTTPGVVYIYIYTESHIFCRVLLHLDSLLIRMDFEARVILLLLQFPQEFCRMPVDDGATSKENRCLLVLGTGTE